MRRLLAWPARGRNSSSGPRRRTWSAGEPGGRSPGECACAGCCWPCLLPCGIACPLPLPRPFPSRPPPLPAAVGGVLRLHPSTRAHKPAAGQPTGTQQHGCIKPATVALTGRPPRGVCVCVGSGGFAAAPGRVTPACSAPPTTRPCCCADNTPANYRRHRDRPSAVSAGDGGGVTPEGPLPGVPGAQHAGAKPCLFGTQG
jgi:hypothetical protein